MAIEFRYGFNATYFVRPTPTPTKTPTPTPSNTPTVTPTVTVTPSDMPLTPTPTNTPTNTTTPSVTATITMTPSVTSTSTNTPTPTVTSTTTVTPTNTPTVTITPTNTVTPTPTNTITPTSTVTPTPTITPTPTPSVTSGGLTTSNLILHYNTFNTSSYNGSGVTITDISGNSRNGTITGSPTWTGNYFTFSDDYITTPNLNAVITSVNETHSVELWVYPTNNGVLVQYNDTTSPNSGYHHSAIEIVGGNLEVGLWNGSVVGSTGNIGAVSFNQWHQIVLTYNGSVCKGYIDGVYKGSVNVSWTSPMNYSHPLFHMNFGSNTTTSQGDATNFDGRFGIMRVYNKALTDAEILSNYNSTLPTIVNLTTSGLVLYYDPSSVSSYPGSGTTITDLSGNGRNGTMSNITYTYPYFTYNGSSSQISIADNALLEPESGDWTMEVWVNQSVSGNDVVLGKFPAGGATVSYSIRTTNTSYYAQVASNSGFQNSTTHVGTIGTWYQIVYVFTNVAANTFQTFVNGASIGSVGHSLTSLLNTTTNLYIGSYNNGEYAQWFDGKIGITRLYNKALTSTEVLNNYNVDKSKYGL